MSDTPELSFYKTLLADVRQWQVEGTSRFFLFVYALKRPGFMATVLYRIAARCARSGKLGQFAGAFIKSVNFFLHGCDISSDAVIGPGFGLPHPSGVVIGMATIGRDVWLLQNVTLGVRHPRDRFDDPKNYPIIGNNVSILAGAVVAGPVKVGDGAMVGANAVVLEDVPENCVAVGVPARILQRRKEAAA